MPRYHHVEGGRIVNAVAAPDQNSIPGARLVPEIDGADIGWLWDEATGTASPPPAGPIPVPASVSDRQFAQALALQGAISKESALAWASAGAIPPEFMDAIQALPELERFDAMMHLGAATTYERAHKWTVGLSTILGWTSEEVDDLFRLAGTL